MAGWDNYGVISQSEVNYMLVSVAWRNVREEWKKEMHEKPKLSMMDRIAEYAWG